MEIVPLIPTAERGCTPTVPLIEIVNTILYKLKTRIQWNRLPVKVLFDQESLIWNWVYYYYRKLCLSDTLKESWIEFIKNLRQELGLSSVYLERNHTSVIRGSVEVEYLVRKKCKITNAPYLTYRQEAPLAMNTYIPGNHNDLHSVEEQFELVTITLDEEEITVEGLPLNAFVSCDSKNYRDSCCKKETKANFYINKRKENIQDRDSYFDQDLYDQRYEIKYTNAWTHSFRSLRNRFDTTSKAGKILAISLFYYSSLKKSRKEKFKIQTTLLSKCQ